MKRCLIIDITYTNTRYKLTNLSNVDNIIYFLEKKFNYSNTVTLKENLATKENIEGALELFISSSSNYDELFIYFCGLSSTVLDPTNEHISKGLLAYDFVTNGIIDDIYLKKLFSLSACKLYVLLDCCYGSGGFNLNYSNSVIMNAYIDSNYDNILSNIVTNNKNDIIIMSMYLNLHDIKNGSKSTKTYGNVLTQRILEVLQDSYFKLNIYDYLQKLFYKFYNDQYFITVPVITSNLPINVDKVLFENKIKERLPINIQKETIVKIETALVTTSPSQSIFGSHATNVIRKNVQNIIIPLKPQSIYNVSNLKGNNISKNAQVKEQELKEQELKTQERELKIKETKERELKLKETNERELKLKMTKERELKLKMAKERELKIQERESKIKERELKTQEFKKIKENKINNREVNINQNNNQINKPTIIPINKPTITKLDHYHNQSINVKRNIIKQ